MKFGPKRAHVMFIFEHFIKDFGLFIIALVLFLIVRDIQIIMDNLVIAAIAVFGPISRLIRFLFTKYTIDGEKLLIESGLLKKEAQEIPLKTISSVDFSQNLLFQITGVYSVNVENAGSLGSAQNGSVKMVLNKEDAVLAKKLLLMDENPEDQSEGHEEKRSETVWTKKATAGELMTLCFLQIKWAVVAAQIVLYFFLLIGFADQYIMRSGKSSAEYVVDLAAGAAPLIIMWVLISLYIVSVVVTALLGMIKYHNFRIADRGDSIFIEYGLFTRKTHTLMKDKISGISYRQSLITRLMKTGTLQIFVAGYGGTDDEQKQMVILLYPVIREEKVKRFIGEILPEGMESPRFEKAPSRSIPYFFLCGRFVFSVVIVALLVLLPLSGTLKMVSVCAGAIIMICASISVGLEYINSAVAVNSNAVIMRYGGFTRHSIVLRCEKIEYVEDIASEIKRTKRHLCTVKAGVLAPQGVASYKVRNMELSIFDKVKSKLIY